MDKRTVGENNKLEALKLIYRFGWLRSQEIGLFLWESGFGVNYNSYKKNAEALVRKLVDQKLVISRKLPQNSGTALFLSKQGADSLLEVGILACSGKNFGRLENGVWSPPSNWKHHLLSSGALGILYRIGYGVITESEIRRKYDLEKYPDGIFYIDYENEEDDVINELRSESFWLEVESHRKTGPNMEFMVDSALRSLLENNPFNNSNQLFGRSINRIAIAYSTSSSDENSNKIDHELRVTNAFRKKIDTDFPINFLQLKMYGLGVSGIIEKIVVIKPKPQYLYA